MKSLIPLALVAFVALGCVQLYAVLTGISMYFGISTFLAFFPAALLAWIPIVSAFAGMWGAHVAWGWTWLEAGALFFGVQAIAFVALLLGSIIEATLDDP